MESAAQPPAPDPAPRGLTRGQRRTLWGISAASLPFPVLVFSGLVFPESNLFVGFLLALPLLLLVYLMVLFLVKAVVAVAGKTWRPLAFPTLAIPLVFISSFVTAAAYLHPDTIATEIVEKASARLERENFTAARLQELLNEEAARTRHPAAYLRRIKLRSENSELRVWVAMGALMSKTYDPAKRTWTYRD